MAVLIGPWLVGSITMSRPGVKPPDLLDERPDEKQQLLQRHELAERHQMHLLIHAGDGAVLPDEERGVVVRLRLVIDLIAAEQQLDAGLAHERANPLAADLVVQERKRRGRLGPDDQLRAFGGGLARQRQIRVQDVVGLRVIPLLLLRNVSLNQRDANLAAPARRARRVSRRCCPTIVTPTSAAAVTPTVTIDPREREMTKYASAVLTSATSADMPNTPTTLANCAIGSTVVWLYPSSSHGKAAPEIRAAELGRHPDRRREQNRAAAVLARRAIRGTA